MQRKQSRFERELRTRLEAAIAEGRLTSEQVCELLGEYPSDSRLAATA